VSFDIFYQPGRFGTEPVEKKNPFTGEVQAVLPAEPLTPRDLDAVKDVLGRVTAVGPDDHGCYFVRLGDGGEVEVHAGHGFETGCMTAIHGGLTADSLRFLLDLLKAADWVMLPAMEGNPAIVAVPGSAEGLGGEFPEVVCGSVEELGAVLAEGLDNWKRYRNQIAGE
jgi:hypothetical protein